MSAARRGAVAATVLLLGFVALLLSPATGRAGTAPLPTSSSSPVAPTQSVEPVASTTTVRTTCVTPIIGSPTCSPITTSLGSPNPTTTESLTTTASTLTYAVLPGNVTSIPPTATPKPAPTPSLRPAATTDTGITALGTDTASATSEFTQASTVINPQPGGDSSSVLPLTVLAFLVIIGGGAIFLITRLR